MLETAFSDVPSDDAVVRQYLKLLAEAPENVAQSYAKLTTRVQDTLRAILDRGDAEYYGTWFNAADENGPGAFRVLISNDIPPVVTVLWGSNSTLPPGSFIVELDHPARTAIETLRAYLGTEDNNARDWVLPSILKRTRERKVLREVDLQRRVLPNSATKRMLRSCFSWESPQEHPGNQWTVYKGYVTLVYDTVSKCYAQVDSGGNIGPFESLVQLVARLEIEIDPAAFPKSHTTG